MSGAPRGRRAPESGFVLVGVLMFILVLTILGLTLFSLSGYEAQFYNRSRDGQRAFYAALGGIERTKFVLSTTGKLIDAQGVSGVPIPGMVYAVAKQGAVYESADSTQPLDWSAGADPVWIRSLAVVNGRRMLLEARFVAHRTEDDYRRLFTLSDPVEGLRVVAQVPDPANNTNMLDVGPQTHLLGGLRQLSTNTVAFAPAGVQPNPSVTGDSVSTPAITGATGYLALHWNHPGFVEVVPKPSDKYDLNASGFPDRVGFFRTPFALADDQLFHAWSLNADEGNPGHANNHYATVTVHGTCIWMFDRGVRFLKNVEITGSGAPDDALIIVSAPSGDPSGVGIGFGGGLGTSTVPLVLVTDGGVGIEQYSTLGEGTSLGYLSVFARRCGVIGPAAGNLMVLRHAANAPEDQPGGLIDRLTQKGYLPNTTSGPTGDLSLIAGTWREIKDSDGKN